MTDIAPSPLLSLPGAVAAGPDTAQSGRTAWHYGGPLTEQRTAIESGALFDRSDRDIITVTGPQRLEWLHSLATQHLTSLQPHHGTEMLILSPTGRIEHHAEVYDDGETTWLDTEPGRGEALRKYLELMKFRTEVDIVDASEEWALLTYTGRAGGASGQAAEDAFAAGPVVQPVPVAKFAAKDLPAVATAQYPGAALAGGWVRRTDALREATYDQLVRRDELESALEAQGERLNVAGTWAFDALRVAAKLPRFGIDTDERTVPHEVPHWLAAAVHLDKGCYRGQETVAKVHHLGQPPRRLVMLHLDGTDEHPPASGTPVTADGKEVGFIGTAVQHYELGQIALAMVKRSVAADPDVRLIAGDQAASL
ncbi:folate-binding protein [Glycomyces sp. TRM65418]|uniref:CAF17-like 4Fe-4S cluster assembly/insertion protein YgfZ n=1 Tax=Glycomyces sp. TRM65418 TaxID=2867006 RepID=UPI001CE5722E|nr:glycine cleavage T C-terminal barrel domain-containing protein [Glycomyces sp. TRM65418]MCC3764107.1 folate-binding protein [Glycomyces sp. TRM65418]QZD53795.1 folate-binding protein [Glycomyces sp. TRM65418]